MIVCSENFFERLEKGEISVIERKRYKICQLVQNALEEIPIFYLARPQGVKAPAAFVRIAKMIYHKRLAEEIECAVLFEVRYLAEKPYDDSECEQAMEKLRTIDLSDLNELRENIREKIEYIMKEEKDVCKVEEPVVEEPMVVEQVSVEQIVEESPVIETEIVRPSYVNRRKKYSERKTFKVEAEVQAE